MNLKAKNIQLSFLLNSLYFPKFEYIKNLDFEISTLNECNFYVPYEDEKKYKKFLSSRIISINNYNIISYKDDYKITSNLLFEFALNKAININKIKEIINTHIIHYSKETDLISNHHSSSLDLTLKFLLRKDTIEKFTNVNFSMDISKELIKEIFNKNYSIFFSILLFYKIYIITDYENIYEIDKIFDDIKNNRIIDKNNIILEDYSYDYLNKKQQKLIVNYYYNYINNLFNKYDEILKIKIDDSVPIINIVFTLFSQILKDNKENIAKIFNNLIKVCKNTPYIRKNVLIKSDMDIYNLFIKKVKIKSYDYDYIVRNFIINVKNYKYNKITYKELILQNQNIINKLLNRKDNL